MRVRDRKMRHKNAGLENATLENTAQESKGWKRREKSIEIEQIYNFIVLNAAVSMSNFPRAYL